MDKIALRILIRAGALALAVGFSGGAEAGPPYITDDPEPTDTGHFENYLYTQGARADGAFSGPGAGVEINYGVLPETQLTASFPLNPNPGPGGMGLVFSPFELGLKYRFVDEDENGWRPQIAFFPQIEFPSGHAAHSVPTTELLPLWFQKSVGDWTLFGGGGFSLNPGDGNRGYLSYGLALAYQLDSRLQLGGEIFGQSRSSFDSPGSAAMGLGAIFDLNETWHLIGSVNTGIVNREADEISYNLALKWTF